MGNAPHSGSMPPPSSGRGQGALLYAVDDEELNLDLMDRALRSGYQVRTFGDPRRALAAAVKEPPSVVVADYRMPHFSGLALLRELRRQGLSYVPVLVCAPTDVEQIQKISRESAAFRIITKPWIASDLRRQVDLAVSLHQLQVARNHR